MKEGRKRILLVEDDGTLRTLYTDALQADGFEVDQAVEGKEGLLKARNGGYNLILLDILLPGLQGPEILEGLRTQPPMKANGPVVMLTNQSQPEILRQCHELGAVGEIIKSDVTPKEFIQFVRGFLDSPGNPGPEA